ncbi:MAG: sugar ABC transporter substrate-binding protein [Christensenellales bacterium]|jgi:ribose transport system substrate-binding protein
MKKLLVWLVCLMLVFSVAACTAPQEVSTSSSGASQPAGQTPGSSTPAVSSETSLTAEDLPVVRIGFCPPEISEVYEIVREWLDAAVEDAKAAGFKVEVLQKDVPDLTPALQIDAVENLLAADINVLLFCPADPDTIIPVLQQCNEAGVKLVCINQLEEFPGSEYDEATDTYKSEDAVVVDSFIGYYHYTAGQLCGYEMLDALGGPGVLGEGTKVDVPQEASLDLAFWEDTYKDFDWSSITAKVAIVSGISGHSHTNSRTNGFLDVVKKCPNVEVVSTLYADFLRVNAIECTENILQANAELDGIYGVSAETGIGISIACENAGRLDDILITCMDGTTSSVDSVLQGKIASDTWLGFPDWGWYGAYFSVRAAMGLPIEHYFDINTRSIIQANTTNFYPNTLLPALDWEGTMKEALEKAANG